MHSLIILGIVIYSIQLSIVFSLFVVEGIKTKKEFFVWLIPFVPFISGFYKKFRRLR